MLHSAPPRALSGAYLATPPPRYNLGTYFEDVLQPFVPYMPPHPLHHHPHHHLQPPHHPEDSYARLSAQSVLAWDTSMSALAAEQQHHHHQQQQLHQQPQRCAPTPFPLDLSLKSTPTTPLKVAEESCEAIEVDDEEDRRSREEIRSHHSLESGRYPVIYDSASSRQDMEEDVVVDDVESQRSFSSGHSYPLHSTPVKRPEPLLVPGLTPPGSALSPVYYSDHHQKPLLMSPSHHHLPPYHLPRGAVVPETMARETVTVGHHHLPGVHAPMTPPSTPSPPQQQHCPPAKRLKESPRISSVTPKHSTKPEKPRAKKKHVRKLKFDEETSSPVSGTVILAPDEVDVCGEIDKFNIVEVTDEARAQMAEIENRLGPYQCKLCKQMHDDAFQLAQHRCRRIANVDYRCPECEKQFNCPANLASHRRWHKVKPKPSSGNPPQQEQQLDLNSNEVSCTRCDMKFGKHSALKKHMASHHPEQNNNNQSEPQHLPSPASSTEMA